MPSTTRARRSPQRRAAVAAAAALVLTLTACGGDDEAAASGEEIVEEAAPGTLTIYSGRNEELAAPILDQLEEAIGTPVDVRYAGSSELAAQLLEEGEATEADLFLSQDAGALGALAKEGRFTVLPAEVSGAVLPGYADAEGRWVGTSARARVIAFDPGQAAEVEQMTSIDEVLDGRYEGEIGYAPTNASFHAFVTALRVTKGEDGARAWLEDFAALDPQAYDANTLVLDAVDSGDVSLGLINHYYWYERVAELGEDAVNARIHFLGSDDPGALVNVAGVGVLAGSAEEEAALAAVEFLLSPTAQQYFADETAEYPVVPGVTTTEHDLVPLTALTRSSVDLNELDSLEQTLALLDEVGLT